MSETPHIDYADPDVRTLARAIWDDYAKNGWTFDNYSLESVIRRVRHVASATAQKEVP